MDLRNNPIDPDERARRNIEEGRGISLKNLDPKILTMNLALQTLCGEHL